MTSICIATAASSSSTSSTAAALPSLQSPPLRLHLHKALSKQRTASFTLKKGLGIRCTASAKAAPALKEEANVQGSSFDPDLFVLDLAEKLEDSPYAPGCSPSGKEALSLLRECSAEAALSSQWPSNKVEAYRFTDVRFLKKANVELAPLNADLDISQLPNDGSLQLIVVDGIISELPSSHTPLPGGAYFTSITRLPEGAIRDNVIPKLGESGKWLNGDFFASLNGVGVQDLGIVIVPDGVKMELPLHVIYYSSQGGQNDGEVKTYALSSPRLLVLVGKGAEVDIVEEFIGEAGKLYWANSVAEFFIEEKGHVRHSCIQNQEKEAVHIKQTSVAQKEGSNYELVEAGLGSRLSRHNLHIEQLGPDTTTKMSSFLLAGQSQLQDLHSRLILSHPRGHGRQLHKCIVMHSSGHCVFDGNIKVNRYAQQTDAGQLSRSLLLAPRATVNVKPNLQIIADDVKCAHGAAISDLEEEQLFYFQARGIDPQTARSTLVFSFGAEVIQQFPDSNLQKRIEGTVKSVLRAEGAMTSSSQ